MAIWSIGITGYITELREKYPDVWGQSGGDALTFLGMLQNDPRVLQEERDRIEQEYANAPAPPPFIEPGEPDTRPVPVATKRRLGDALFDKIKDFFRIQSAELWKDFDVLIKGLINWGIRAATPARDAIANRLFKYSDIPSEQLPFYPPAIKTRMMKYSNDPTITDGLMLALWGTVYGLGRGLAYLLVTLEDAKRHVNKAISPEIPDIGTLLTVYMRYDGDRQLVTEKARELGYDTTEIEIFLKAIHPLLDPLNLRDLFLRGEIDEKEHDLRLYQHGYDTKQISQVKELYKFIPGPNDLVRMAIREAWADEYAEHWGADKQYPKEFEEWAGKQGMTPYWAKRFWRAHWDIPSVMQGFEMLHRNVIGRDDLEELMKALDIMPGWRDRLLKISFNPLTRVDVRRMYRVGVLSIPEVKQAYLALGYDDINADRMTEFTILYTSETERDLTKADILGVYQRDMIDTETADGLLVNMGYDPIEASVLTARIDYDEVKKKKTVVAKNLAKAYKRRLITEADVYTRTLAFGFTRPETANLILEWELEKADARTPLTRGDLDRLVKAKKISVDDYMEELASIGYGSKDIDRLVSLNTGT